MTRLKRNPPPTLLAGLLLAALLALSPAEASAQGQFNGVSDDEVQAMRLNHYFTADKQYRDADFEWDFDKDSFTLKAGAGDIPNELQEQLLPKGITAREIRGKWHLEDRNGKALVLTEIRVDGAKEPQKKTAALPIYKTAPTVVRVGRPQYVFGIGP